MPVKTLRLPKHLQQLTVNMTHYIVGLLPTGYQQGTKQGAYFCRIVYN